MSTQTQKIAKHLMRGRSLTQLQALDQFGSMRLAARIKDIRDRCGEDSVKTIRVPTSSGAVIARYLGDPTALRRVYG